LCVFPLRPVPIGQVAPCIGRDCFGLTRRDYGHNRARQQCRRVLQIEHTRDCRRREIHICREKHGANAAVWKVEG